MSTYPRERPLRAITAAAVLSGLLAVAVIEWSGAAARAADAGTGEPWQAPARAARKKNPIAADERSVIAGKAVYAKECLSCHGEGGKGDGPAAKDLNPKPNDLTAAKVWEQTDGALFWKLTEGKKPMPAYDKLLPDDDRWHVINYIRGTFAPKGRGNAPQ